MEYWVSGHLIFRMWGSLGPVQDAKTSGSWSPSRVSGEGKQRVVRGRSCVFLYNSWSSALHKEKVRQNKSLLLCLLYNIIIITYCYISQHKQEEIPSLLHPYKPVFVRTSCVLKSMTISSKTLRTSKTGAKCSSSDYLLCYSRFLWGMFFFNICVWMLHFFSSVHNILFIPPNLIL